MPFNYICVIIILTVTQIAMAIDKTCAKLQHWVGMGTTNGSTISGNLES